MSDDDFRMPHYAVPVNRQQLADLLFCVDEARVRYHHHPQMASRLTQLYTYLGREAAGRESGVENLRESTLYEARTYDPALPRDECGLAKRWVLMGWPEANLIGDLAASPPAPGVGHVGSQYLVELLPLMRMMLHEIAERWAAGQDYCPESQRCSDHPDCDCYGVPC